MPIVYMYTYACMYKSGRNKPLKVFDKSSDLMTGNVLLNKFLAV